MPAAEIPSEVREYLERRRLQSADVRPLTGDASDRRYFRVRPECGASFVVAKHAEPFDPDALPFLNVARLFEAMPVPVPRVLGEAGDLGVIALDDLGDMTLQARLGSDGPAGHSALYRAAVALIEIFQRRGRELADARFVPYGLAFDVEKLLWEMRFFVTHFLEGHRGARLDAAARSALDAEFLPLVTELAAEPRVLCHRDYHSRNLMVSGSALYVIDFQDARMGPDTYDLVSLLRDSYVDIPDAMVGSLIAEFLALGRRQAQAAEFRRRFDLMAVQRNLKALGTFGYQASVRRNATYVQYVPRTLAYTRDNLFKYDRFAPLRRRLALYLEEFRA